MEAIEQYLIVTASTSYELSKKVNDILKQGWQLIDGHKVTLLGGEGSYPSREYSQTLVKFFKK